jgi:hypothetical protein
MFPSARAVQDDTAHSVTFVLKQHTAQVEASTHQFPAPMMAIHPSLVPACLLNVSALQTLH